MKKLNSAILLVLILAIVGCSNRLKVIDESGGPLVGVKVSAVTLSMNDTGSLTDKNGLVSIPSSYGFQDVKWIDIQCSGYQSQHIEVMTKLPNVIILIKDSRY